jgi:hypothetical protein
MRMADNLTPFSDQCVILADLWLNYRHEEQFTDFMEYNDIGLPLAYAVANKVAEVTPTGESLIEETFSLLIEGLGLDDTGFDSLDEVLSANTFLEDGE